MSKQILSNSPSHPLAILVYYDNVTHTFPGNQDPKVKVLWADYSEIGIFVGIGAWAYEAAGTIFSVRMSMEKPTQIEGIILRVFTLIGFLFIIFSLSFSLVLS